MKENSIEETIKQLELILKARKIHKECVGESCINCNSDIEALTNSIEFLSDYKRVLKENEELLEIRISAGVYNRIIELERENAELKKFITEGITIEPNSPYKNYQLDFLRKNFIPRQNIKDKIEELNKKEQELQNSISDEEREEYSDASISFDLMDINIRREVLQELIEESEEK